MSLADGIYFGLDESVYHADTALGSSGLRSLLIGTLDYWVNSPLNPDYEEEDTDAKIVGTAFHRRLLEPNRFPEMYATKPSKDDYPDAIDGGKALQAECERLGLKKSGKISDLCERILEACPTARLWPVIEDGLLQERAGKILLKPQAMSDIERAAAIVEKHESVRRTVDGGYSEVSIFWTDEETGTRLKVRTDYLKVKALIDVKTFSNPFNKPVDVAVGQAVANGRYDVQAAMYLDGVENAKRMLRERKSAAIRNLTDDEIAPEWILALAACERHAFFFLFVQQGAVTNVRVREWREVETIGGMGHSANLYWSNAAHSYRAGVHKYAECMKRFGPDEPWIEDAPIRAFQDSDLPMWLYG